MENSQEKTLNPWIELSVLAPGQDLKHDVKIPIPKHQAIYKAHKRMRSPHPHPCIIVWSISVYVIIFPSISHYIHLIF